VKILLDSSVLIPGLVASHPRHELCHPYLQAAKARKFQAYLSTHSLAEVYAVITRLPVKPRPSPQQVQSLLEDLLSYTNPVPLDSTDYTAAIGQMVTLNLPGEGIFDAR
jgi:predicted nucleic acid-binding protein